MGVAASRWAPRVPWVGWVWSEIYEAHTGGEESPRAKHLTQEARTRES